MVILGVLINETCYKTGRVSTRDFTAYEKVHVRSDFRKKKFLAGARTQKSIILVKGKNSICTSLIMNTLYTTQVEQALSQLLTVSLSQPLTK